MTELQFPAGFRWGTATASYQIEGGAHEDERGTTIWDTFSRTPGKVVNGDTGDVACDHYHRWKDDIQLLKALNCTVYRLSAAWSRLFPSGRGRLNEKGVDFYSRIVDELLANGITPYVTLYHWDLPQALQDEGGWTRRGIVDDFAAYTDALTQTLGDRVKHWITLNEPWVFTWLGYAIGIHAPGYVTTDPSVPLTAAHHALLAHGAAVERVRANVPDAQVGITLNLTHVDPATARPSDLEAMTRHDGFFNRWFLDPVLRGHYPADMLAYWQEYLPPIEPGDMAKISIPTDFLGINYYSRAVVEHNDTAPYTQAMPVRPAGEGHEYTDMGWEVYPQGLYTLLKRLHTEYHPKALYITENGAAFPDELTPDGAIHDEARVNYLRRHFEAASHAIRDGVPLLGYFVWSFMDNFEWAEGYAKRFGITYVDYATQRRTFKDSAKYFASIAAQYS
ncbi:MAG: GH1 family beta-glucosidase [bacterium]|nr:GH1 family beta-glucosidase [bacterium]